MPKTYVEISREHLDQALDYLHEVLLKPEGQVPYGVAALQSALLALSDDTMSIVLEGANLFKGGEYTDGLMVALKTIEREADIVLLTWTLDAAVAVIDADEQALKLPPDVRDRAAQSLFRWMRENAESLYSASEERVDEEWCSRRNMIFQILEAKEKQQRIAALKAELRELGEEV